MVQYSIPTYGESTLKTDIAVNITVVMPRLLLAKLEKARIKKNEKLNRSAFIRELIEKSLEQAHD